MSAFSFLRNLQNPSELPLPFLVTLIALISFVGVTAIQQFMRYRKRKAMIAGGIDPDLLDQNPPELSLF